MKQVGYILLIAALGLAANQSRGGTEAEGDSRWEAAALNRDAAAHAQSSQGLFLLTQADEQRNQDSTTDEEHRRYLAKAGSLEMSAGALFWKSRANFDKAAESWGKSAVEHGKRGAHQLARAARSRKVESATSAKHACHLAAQSYERAADAYARKHAADFTKSAMASEKAAECREFIARQP